MSGKPFADMEADVAAEAIEPSKQVALPRTVQDLLNQRKTGQHKTLNDFVEAIHLSLWEVPEYQGYLRAVYVEQAIEGDLFCDDIEAARMIRERASKEGNAVVKDEKLATIRKALLVVLRRYRIDRKGRRGE
jgi:hypothetical protein